MAISIPAARLGVKPQNYRRTRPCLSGSAAADQARGFRGINNEVNHGYAHLVRQLGGYFAHDQVAVKTTAGAVYEDLTEEIVVELGADVSAIRAVVWGSDIRVRIVTDEGTGGDSNDVGAAAGAATATYTLVDQTGAVRVIHLEFRVPAAGPTATVYGWTIQEVALVAGDVP